MVAVNPWTLRYDGYDPSQTGLREALCTVGNGYVATRGAAPEVTADRSHSPGTYAAGVVNRLESEIAGRTIANESVVNLPNWLPLSFRIDGGDWFHIDHVEVLEHVLELDLRHAVLHRHVRFRDAAGRTTAVSQRRFASMAAAHVLTLETTIVAENWTGRLEIRSAIDGAVRNTGVERYRDLPSDHLDIVAMSHTGDDIAQMLVETNQSAIRVAIGCRTRLRQPGFAARAERHPYRSDTAVGHELAIDMSIADTVTVEKVAMYCTSRDAAVSEPGEHVTRWLARIGDIDALLDEHRLAWAHLWDRFHVEARGSDESMRSLRLHLVHLLQTVSPNTVDLDVGVPARGLHGEAYRGHIFWDELFVFPILNLRLPALTRSLLDYRYRRLPEARHAARAEGYRGAMFPWQSGSDGREESQVVHLNPESGRWLADATHLQRHINNAIAYNVWQYQQVTDDRDFFDTRGVELLIEIARFWASIAEFDDERDRYVIRGVVGPDEFHTKYPDTDRNGIDNNAYTNVMAAWSLLRAVEALGMLGDAARREFMDRFEFGPTDVELWQDVARRMFVPFHGDGIISQFEGYDDLQEFDWDDYRERYDDIRRLDRILEAEGDSPNAYKLSKQADVLMLFYLLSADELRELLASMGYELTADMIPRNIDYYTARSSHGSTLSSVVHAWVLARGDRDRALDHLEEALRADVADIQGGTTAEGIHLAAMCGSVDLVQRCFTGLETRADRLLLDPCWPHELGELCFHFHYRDVPLTVDITPHQVEVSADAGAVRTLQIGCRDELVELRPGSSVVFRNGAPNRA